MEHLVWAEKYRPSKVEEVILPRLMKDTFGNYVASGEFDTNILLAGNPGMGKTSVVLAALQEMGNEYYFINASLKGNIDTLRYEIQQFASTVSFDGKRKYVVLDEMDKLTSATQDGLRGFIEEFAKTCGFIGTCNNPSKISGALHSRFSLIEFKAPQGDERIDLMKTFFKRVVGILNNEGVEFDKAVVRDIVADYFPDFRKTLNTLQTIAKANGRIAEDTYVKSLDDNFEALIDFMRKPDWNGARGWVAENSNIDAIDIFRRFYDTASVYIKKEQIPYLVKLIADYQYKHASAADPEINVMAFISEVMIDFEFK